MLVPSVEDAAEEIAVLLWGNGEVGYAVGFGIGLDAGDELEEADFVFDEEVEYLVGVVGVYVVEKNEQIEFDFEFAAVVDGSHDAVPCTGAGEVETVVVVILFWAVDADSDEEIVLVQEGTPFFVEQDCVCLECVADYLAGFAILFL